MVLDEWFPTLQAQHLKQLEKWDKNETARDKRIKNVQEQNKAPKEKDLKLTPKPEMDKWMLPDDADISSSLLQPWRFYWAAQSSLRASLTQKRCFKPTFCVPEGTSFHFSSFKVYCWLYMAQNHPNCVKPNFHWVTHIFDQILDYGPVYGFWTFIFEWLNKVLKSYSVNNHGGGEIETTFCRKFMQNADLRWLVSMRDPWLHWLY